jgi:class 3 adenylate cyclase/tetratricopeptide (TPR) repeat protein
MVLWPAYPGLMICPSCGALAAEASRFCPACGHALPSAAARGDERRLVTVLFADLVGYTALAETRDPEQVKNLVDRCFERLAADIVGHGGRVDKIIGDAILALFGAPLAHEDDAERAVRAALQMQCTIAAWSAELGVDIRMRVGINSGEVLVGALRAGGDYTAMGDVVNTASRLQTAAQPSQVLVGLVTHAATRDVLRYEPLGAVRARGREEPVPAWLAVEAVAPPGHRPRRVRTPLIGRDAELGLLRHAFAVAADRRRAHLVVLSGEAGTGKTRLAEELAMIARAERHAIVLEGRCLPYGESNVWWPLAEALRQSCGITPADDHRSAEAKGRAAVAVLLGADPHGRDVERVLHGLIYLMDKSTKIDVEPARARDEALRSVQVCLERMTVERPLLFIVSELHWADDLLLEFLDGLLGRLQHLPVLLLGTARPELADRWHPPEGRHNQILLHIDPLDASATSCLLSELLDDAQAPELRETLVERSGGNPLYLEELVALLARDQPFDELPVTLRGLVAARLDTLRPAERESLEDAAVVGRTGTLDALVAMAGPDRQGEVAAAVEALVTSDLLVAVDGEQGCPAWEFRSELVREVAYAILSKAERARRHAALAGWLVAASQPGSRRANDDIDRLAYHYGIAAELVGELGGVAGVPADLGATALEWVQRAADRAESEELWPAAAGLLDQALRLAVHEPGATTRLSLARARARIGMRDVAGANADLAAALASAPAQPAMPLLSATQPSSPALPLAVPVSSALSVSGPDLPGSVALNEATVLAQVLVLTGEVQRLEGNMEASTATLERAVALARNVSDDHVVADALRALGQTRLFTGDEEGADIASVEALGAYRNLGDRRGEAWALQSLAWTAFLRGDLGPAEDRIHASADAFSEIGDWGGHAWALGLLGWVRFSQGRLDEAEELGRSLLSDSQTGDKWAVGMMRVLLANVSLWKGRTAEAVAMATEARELFIAIHDPWAEMQAIVPMARSLLALGQIDAGRQLLDDVAGSVHQLVDPRMARLARGAVAIARTQQLGEGPAVVGLARDLVESAGAEVMPEQLSVLGLALIQAGELVEGVEVLERAVSGTGRDDQVPQPNCGTMLAIGYLAAGRIEEASATLARHSGPGLGTYADRSWAAVARGFLARAGNDRSGLASAFAEARAEVDATEDRLAQAVVRLAHHIALSPPGDDRRPGADPLADEVHDRLERLGVTFTGWDRVLRSVGGEASAPDAVALAT